MYQVLLRRQEYPTPEITIFCVIGAGRNTSLQRFRIVGWPDKRLKSAKGPLPSVKNREVHSRKKRSVFLYCRDANIQTCQVLTVH